MYENWDISYDPLSDIDASNHSSLNHKGRIALKRNDPEEEKRIKNRKTDTTWHRKGSWSKRKNKKPDPIIYTDGKKHLSAEQRLKISQNHADMRGEKNPMFGRKHSPETIMKLKMLCKNMEGENNPMFGKKHTEETKRKIAKKRNRPLLVEGKFFESIKEAMSKVVISIKDLRGRIAEGVPGYKFLNKDEIQQYL